MFLALWSYGLSDNDVICLNATNLLIMPLNSQNATETNGSNASNAKGLNATKTNGLNASTTNKQNATEANGSNASTANKHNATEANGSNATDTKQLECH